MLRAWLGQTAFPSVPPLEALINNHVETEQLGPCVLGFEPQNQKEAQKILSQEDAAALPRWPGTSELDCCTKKQSALAER